MTRLLCKDSQKNLIKTVLNCNTFCQLQTQYSDIHKEIETFFKNKLKWIQEICFNMNPLSSELPFHVHNWLIISLKDFCIVNQKMTNFLAI